MDTPRTLYDCQQHGHTIRVLMMTTEEKVRYEAAHPDVACVPMVGTVLLGPEVIPGDVVRSIISAIRKHGG